ncbi:MAG: hypothetical protein EHM61_07350 [Acidobacteria bacterium]|nr:MAG: hypothetical protein EHM61_07350 [Acidobacteriota bacterium]
MHTERPIVGCRCCQVNRRRFLITGGAACAGAISCLGVTGLAGALPSEKTRIRIIYALHEPVQNRPDWPNQGFDFVPVMDRVNAELRKQCPGFEFLTSMAKNEEETQKLLAEDGAAPVDGYLVYQLNCWNKAVQPAVATGRPVLYADFQYGGSGGFLVYTAAMLRSKAPNFGFVASSRLDDVVAMVQCFRKGASPAEFAAATARIRKERTAKSGDLGSRPDPVKTLSAAECVRSLKASRILAIRDQNAGAADPIAGIPVERVSFAELNDAWKAADRDQSREVAERWVKGAARVEGVSKETLEASAAMYLGMRSVLRKHAANAITVNCLGGFYGGHIHAYPCLGFHELCNEGLIGACECDVESTATMVAITELTQGRPGYISDPVIDTAKGQIIYAHCVASNRAFGPKGEANSYEILTHSEDRQGASVRSILPLGYMTTTVKISSKKPEIIFHRGRAVANDPDDRACRTKLCVEPAGDMEKLFAEWDQWGWHRVTFYGDLKEPIYALAEALKLKVVEEA